MKKEFCEESPCAHQNPKIELVWVNENGVISHRCPMCHLVYGATFRVPDLEKDQIDVLVNEGGKAIEEKI